MKLFNNMKFKLSQNKGDIKFYGGVACIVIGTVAACAAAFKAKEELEKMADTLDEIKAEAPETEDAEKEQQKRITYTYIKTGAKIGALMIPAIAFEGMGIHLVTKDHKQLKTDVATLGSALTANMNEFKSYRKRVVEKEGKDADFEYMYGSHTEEIVEQVPDEESGEMIETHSAGRFVDKSSVPGYSIYSRVFDDGCKGWTKDPEVNMSFLMNTQSMMTDKLRDEGFLVLNDVYEALGFPKTAIGYQVGWCLGMGDDYVDFGLYDVWNDNGSYDSKKGDFINGYERVVILDFNLDGYILNNLPLGREKAGEKYGR